MLSDQIPVQVSEKALQSKILRVWTLQSFGLVQIANKMIALGPNNGTIEIFFTLLDSYFKLSFLKISGAFSDIFKAFRTKCRFNEFEYLRAGDGKPKSESHK